MELSSKSKSRKENQKLELARPCFSWKFISNGWSPWNFVRFGMVTFEMLVYSLPETNQSCPWTVQPEIAPRPEMNHRLQHHWKKNQGVMMLSFREGKFFVFFLVVQNTAQKWGQFVGAKIFLWLALWNSGGFFSCYSLERCFLKSRKEL